MGRPTKMDLYNQARKLEYVVLPAEQWRKAVESPTVIASLRQVLDGLDLSEAQQRYIAARHFANEDGQAAKSIGLSPATIRVWRNRHPDFVKAEHRFSTVNKAELTANVFMDMDGIALGVLGKLLTSADEKSNAFAIQAWMRARGIWQQEKGIPVDVETLNAIRTFQAVYDAAQAAQRQTTNPEPLTLSPGIPAMEPQREIYTATPETGSQA